MRYFEVASRLIAQEPNKEITGCGLGLRHIQILLQFFLATIFVAMNMTLPIAIIAMTTPKNSTEVGVSCFPNWTDQSLILVSVQCGYAVTQLFGGCVCRAYGYQFVMCFSMFLCSIFCLLLPILTENFSSEGLLVCLIIQGASQGFALPVIPDYLDKWLPSSERNSIGSLMYAANALGSALATKIAAYISASFLGWSFTYYLFGCLGIVWTYLMLQFGRNTPENCEDITAEEREYIKYEKKVKDKVPWRKILNSPALLAIWAAHAGTFWTLWIMTAEIPTYLSKVLKFSIVKDGDMVSDAYFMSWLFSFIMDGVTSYLIRSKILSLNVTRKISQSIASYVAAVCLIILGFLSDPHWVIFFLGAIFVALTASFYGFMLNYNDITHNRGIVTEVGGFIATVTSIFPALLKQFIVTDQTDRTEWAILFWITAVVAILSNTAFFFYSSGDIQEWDAYQRNKDEGSVLKVSKEEKESKYLMGRRTRSDIRSHEDYGTKEGSSEPTTTLQLEEESSCGEQDRNKEKDDDETESD